MISKMKNALSLTNQKIAQSHGALFPLWDHRLLFIHQHSWLTWQLPPLIFLFVAAMVNALPVRSLKLLMKLCSKSDEQCQVKKTQQISVMSESPHRRWVHQQLHWQNGGHDLELNWRHLPLPP